MATVIVVVTVVVTVVGKNAGLCPWAALMKWSTNHFRNYSTV